jgi:FixJ family two-component response regulator
MAVDDERDALFATKLMLERSGYLVHAFSDPSLALKHLKEDRCGDCSFVITDIKMPKMTGLELARYVKQVRPEMTIVLMTSFPIRKEEWRKVLPSTGIDDFIAKPFSTEELIDMIKKCAKEKPQLNSQ